METPSFTMIPSGIDTNELFSVLPSDGGGDYTFARADTNASRINAEGLVEFVATGIPRLDYPLVDGVVQSCPDLLLEPTSENLCVRSEEFDNASWNKDAGVVVTPNFAIAPDGTLTMDRIVFPSSNKLVSQGTSLTPTNICSGSIYIQGVNGETIQIASGGVDELFVLDGTLQRLISNNVTSISSSFIINTYGAATARDINIWGAQLEELPYATSYIKTEGFAETRLSETCNNAGDVNTFNSVEGTFYVQMSALFDTLFFRRISISDGTTNNRVSIFYDNVSNRISASIQVATVLQASLSHVVTDITDIHKVAFKWKEDDFALWINGTEVDFFTDTGSSFSADVLTEISFDHGGGNDIFYGRTRDKRVYKTALSDAKLEELTT